MTPPGIGYWGGMPGLAYVETPPVASNSPGEPGQCSFDSQYFYLCIAANTWARMEVFTW